MTDAVTTPIYTRGRFFWKGDTRVRSYFRSKPTIFSNRDLLSFSSRELYIVFMAMMPVTLSQTIVWNVCNEILLCSKNSG